MAIVRLLADEDLSNPIVVDVRRSEPAIQIATIVELGHGGMTDDQVQELAHRDGWLVVSHDANTMTAAAYARMAAGRPMAGLIIARQGLSTHLVAQDLILIWSASSAEEWYGIVTYLPL